MLHDRIMLSQTKNGDGRIVYLDKFADSAFAAVAVDEAENRDRDQAFDSAILRNRGTPLSDAILEKRRIEGLTPVGFSSIQVPLLCLRSVADTPDHERFVAGRIRLP